jgi:hypothetical protein
MAAGRKDLKTLFRRWSAMVTFVWIAAQALCFAHCHFGAGHGDGTSAPASCHGAASVPMCHEAADASEQPQREPSLTLTCITLKTVLVEDGAPPLLEPGLPVLYEFESPALALRSNS